MFDQFEPFETNSLSTWVVLPVDDVLSEEGVAALVVAVVSGDAVVVASDDSAVEF